jgi:hypothetical protein
MSRESQDASGLAIRPDASAPPAGADGRLLQLAGSRQTAYHPARLWRVHGPGSFRIGIDVGGWGLPFQRSIMRVEEDLARDLITRDQSKSRYGVVVKPGSPEKDDHLTYRVRHYLLSTLAVEDIIAGEELLD